MKTRLGAWLMMLAAALFVTGCGTGEDENAAPAVDVTGTWDGATDTGVPIHMTLTQIGNNVQGSAGDGVLIGFVSTNEFEAMIIYSNGPATSLGSTVRAKVMSGNYAVKGCDTSHFTVLRK